MEYETEEQQVEALKNWWAENGRAVIAGVVLGGAVIGGWTFWQSHSEGKSIAASDAYSRTMVALSQDNPDNALKFADEAQEDNPNHLYAAYAGMAAALAAVEKGDLVEAGKRLQWVVDNVSQSDVKHIAQVRLARVRGAEGEAAAGLATLPSSYPEAFTGMVEEARGDLHMQAGDTDAARTAYQAAAASEFVANREGLTMKLNELAQPGDNEDTASESTS